MKTIEAFKCEHTGGIYADRRSAAVSEFRALMRKAAGSMPAYGAISSSDIMAWLASTIEGEIYQTVPDHLRAALDYFDANLRRKTFDDVHDGHIPEGPTS